MKKVLLLLFFLLTPVLSAEAAKPIKILIVPGHDNVSSGAVYGEHTEADMTLEVATRLFDILDKDKRFDPVITRDRDGYTKEFEKYFDRSAKSIAFFIKKAKAAREKKIKKGNFEDIQGVPHNNASKEVIQILYGINKWANSKSMDAVIHIHFNDYPRTPAWAPGVYQGFAIYYPEEQMINSKKSQELGKNIFKTLQEKYSSSTYPPESAGLVPEQELIAVGANDTLSSKVRSLLIEYEYIYKFENRVDYRSTYEEMAKLTAKGIENYFFPK